MVVLIIFRDKQALFSARRGREMKNEIEDVTQIEHHELRDMPTPMPRLGTKLTL